MAKKFDATAFSRIKDALNKNTGSGGQFENIMKFPEGHTYTLRLLPIMEEGKEPLFHHWVNSWTSKSTGLFVSALSLKTFGERDPISDLRWKLFKQWKDANPNAENKDYAGEIAEKEQWLINVYVIDDPKKPENNGTVKILRMGPQLKEIIDRSTEGEKAEELGLGWEIFDPTAGHDFKIVAEKQGTFTTFKESYFTPKSKTVLTDDDLEEIYENVHDLNAVYNVKTADELTTMLNEHFFCGEETTPETKKSPEKKAPKKSEPKKNKPAVVQEDVDDDIPFEFDTPVEEVNVDELLDGLELEG